MKTKGLNLASRLSILVLLALLLLFPGVNAFVVLFFIPIIGWFVWRDHDRIEELEKQMATLIPPPVPEKKESSPAQS